MANFNVETFIAELESLGVRLTALRLADGSLKVYRWRMHSTGQHAEQSERLWNSEIGGDQSRIDLLAEHLLRADEKRQSSNYYASRPPSDDAGGAPPQ